MKPTYQQVDELVAACTALGDTYNKTSQRGGQDYTDPVPYRFGAKSKDVRQAAAHNLRLLRPYQEEFTDQKNAMLMDVTEGKGHIERHEGELNARYNMKLRELQRTPVKDDLPLEHIAEADLNLEQNPIPPSVIATLAIIPAPKPPTDA
jgi:hypothetical protein